MSYLPVKAEKKKETNMKTIGLIGGISWKSTIEYYRIINQEINKRLGGKHSAKILMYSFDFDEIEKLNQNNEFEKVGQRLMEESVNIVKAGAEMIMLCANTAHQWAEKVKENTGVPIIHIADATGSAIRNSGITDVLLLGTKFTMEGEFVKSKLVNDYDLNVIVPGYEDRQKINEIIYNELVIGDFNEESKTVILQTIKKTKKAQGVILGCTELPLIIKPEDCKIRLYNTTELHARAAIDYALKN